jgi:hypothetical protein
LTRAGPGLEIPSNVRVVATCRVCRRWRGLVNNRVDAVVAAAPPAVQAAKGATTSLPVIAIDLDSDDPVASGLIASPSNPYLRLERANQATTTRGQP